MSIESTRTIVFDAVGTLIRPVESISAVYCRTAQRFGSELVRQQVQQRFSEARSQLFDNRPEQPSSDELEKQLWHQLVRSVFRELDDLDSLFRELWQYYADPTNWMLFPEVPECLEMLWSRKWQVAIASNFDSRLLPICKQIVPLNRIENVFCSGLIGFRKPDLRFFRNVEQLLGDRHCENDSRYRPTMVGDDYDKDVLGAESAGWHAIHIDRSGADSKGDLMSLDWNSIRRDGLSRP